QALEFGLLARRLARRRKAVGYGAMADFILGNFITTHSQPLRAGLPYLEDAFVGANQSGDINLACYCCHTLIAVRISAGDPLDQVYEDSERRLDFVQRTGFVDMANVLVSYQHFIRCLRGQTRHPATYDEAGFNETAFD